MTTKRQPRLLRSIPQWIALTICVVMGIALFALVDLAPEIEADFFFSSDDPQLRQSMRIEKEFGDAPQVFVAVRAARLVSRDYLLRLRDLTQDLQKVRGVADARSITHGPEKPDEVAERDPEEVFEDLHDSPFWTQLLLSPDRSASFVVLRLKRGDHALTVKAIDRVIARYSLRGSGLALQAFRTSQSTFVSACRRTCDVSASPRSASLRCSF